MGPYRAISTYRALVSAADLEPFVRWAVPPEAAVTGWALETGVAFLGASPAPRRTLTVACSTEEAAVAVPRLLAGPVQVERLTVPRGSTEELSRMVRMAGEAEWDWLSTNSAPASQPGEAQVQLLPDAQQEVADLLALASPRHSTTPGSPDVRAWYGVRVHGQLVACAAHSEHVPGVPHLASVATHPDHRGQGWGAALTAAVTRAGLRAGAPAVTLGVYADNACALRLYDRLGFRHGRRFSSRTLMRP